MRVEELQHYGKDLFSISEQSKLPLRKKLAIAVPFMEYMRDVVRTLGLKRTRRFVGEVKEEIQRAEMCDWSKLKEKGISDAHLGEIIKKIALAKKMAETMGMEKAARLRNKLSRSIAIPVFEETFAPAEVFIQCGDGDFLPAFKKYYGAMMEAMAQKGLEEAEVVEDKPDVFQLNVTYCAWAEVAKGLGDPYYCYYSTCYGDEVYFPYLCSKAGFEFERNGTLAQGAPVCDLRFTRKR
ncbi:MAG: L-2-amino-thiazoline-4-carboxylic acid hydrolase, partial [Anaerolineae bacterium]|nr:L-2-amino-thiazoline-4-carboxylic acid hydrolase [Anaerolineae bacterium]